MLPEEIRVSVKLEQDWGARMRFWPRWRRRWAIRCWPAAAAKRAGPVSCRLTGRSWRRSAALPGSAVREEPEGRSGRLPAAKPESEYLRKYFSEIGI